MSLTSFPLLLVGFIASTSPLAREIVCADSPVTAVGWSFADAEQVCSAAQKTFDWLRTMGLPLSERLIVRPFDEQDVQTDENLLGRYNARTNEILILPFDAALTASLERPPAFGVPMTRGLWRSYIAHEVAHAIVHRHFASGVPRLTASEYIASVAQLLALTDANRDQILANYRNVTGWSSPAEITAIVYLMEPSVFTVKAYRHFMALPPTDQREFIRRLLREGLKD